MMSVVVGHTTHTPASGFTRLFREVISWFNRMIRHIWRKLDLRETDDIAIPHIFLEANTGPDINSFSKD